MNSTKGRHRKRWEVAAPGIQPVTYDTKQQAKRVASLVKGAVARPVHRKTNA